MSCCIAWRPGKAAFRDCILAARLRGLAGDRKEIETIQPHHGSDLGTAHKVILRVLQNVQKRGLIVQSRGCAALIDRPALRGIADSP